MNRRQFLFAGSAALVTPAGLLVHPGVSHEKTAEPSAMTSHVAPNQGASEIPQFLATREMQPGPYPGYTFENFVATRSNQLAHAAALQVARARQPGDFGNPLYIYGGSGVGKTHLMSAIAHEIRTRDPQVRISFESAASFPPCARAGEKIQSFTSFRWFDDAMDVLLLDDVQVLSGRPRAQVELVRLLDALVERRRQVVITANALPRTLVDFKESLASRFGWGLCVFIEPPDLETRAAILLAKAKQQRIGLDLTVGLFVARNVRPDGREVASTLKWIVAHSRLRKEPITLALAKQALRDRHATRWHPEDFSFARRTRS